MNNETKKIFVLALTVFIIVCTFVPAFNPLPTVNNSKSTTPLIQVYTDSINSSHSSDVEDWFHDVIGISGYAEEYMVALDNLIFVFLGVLLVMFIIGVIILIVGKKGGNFGFIRIIAILNTLTYAALIALTFYQSNKLSNDTWGFSDSFIRISPSIGAYIGFISSLVLAFIATRGHVQVADQHAYHTQSGQNPHIMNDPLQEQMRTQVPTQTAVNISGKMNETMMEAKGKVNNFLANQKEKIKTEYETVEKEFKGLGLDDIISSSREFCYRNQVLKYIMPYIGIILILQTVIVGMTLLFGLDSYSRFTAIRYISNSDIFFAVVVALCLIKKNYVVVAIYETLSILFHFIVYGGAGSFTWINLLVMIIIDIYAIRMLLKDRELNKGVYHQIQEQIACPSCGKSCNKGVNFCSKCGNSLS